MMQLIEQLLINGLLNIFTMEQINAFTRDPRSVAIVVGALVAFAAAWPGVFLLLRKMSLTSDAISHTVLLGIVVVFFIMIAFGVEPSLNSPLLLIGATAAGVLTVFLTEVIQRSGLVKSDAALGLVFPLLFAIAVIAISRFAEDVHLDTDAVLIGDIGVAWANTTNYCFARCDEITITPDSDLAETGRRCTNCSRGGISPRDPEAIFEETCSNCGTYSAAEAWRERLIDQSPELVYWPKALTIMLLITLLNAGFIGLFYKELKLAAFDEQLAKALGFHPVRLTYVLMTLVSLTAVGAFDAVGAIMVVAFFVIPPATAYLLTNRLSLMLLMAPLFGVFGAFAGYEFARGSFFGLPVSGLLVWLDGLIGLEGYTEWNVSISASMVLMTFVFFLVAWVMSPRYGLLSQFLKQRRRQQQFAAQMLLGHVYNHEGTSRADSELALETLHQHLNWSETKVQAVLTRCRMRGWLRTGNGLAHLTDSGRARVERFRSEKLHPGWQNDRQALAAVGD